MFGTFGRLQDVSSSSITSRDSKEVKNIIGFELTSLELREGTDTSENHHAVILALLNRVAALENDLTNLTLQLYGVTQVVL